MPPRLEVAEQVAVTHVLDQQTDGLAARAAAQHADDVVMVTDLLHQLDLPQEVLLVGDVTAVCIKIET